MPKPYLLLGISTASAVLALTTSVGWVRVPLVGIGLASGSTYLLHNIDTLRRQKQQALLWSDRYSLMLRSLHCLEKELQSKTLRLAELDHLSNSEMERLSQDQQAKVEALTQQAVDLEALIKEQWEELEAQEKRMIANANAQIEESKRKVEEQLTAQAKEDEAWLESELDRLTNLVEADKQKFLETHTKELNRLRDRIDYLESQLVSAKYQIEELEAPRLPEGVEQNELAARRVMQVLIDHNVICDFVHSHIEQKFIVVDIRPRDGGIREIKKHLDRLQIELALAETPDCEVIPGAVRLFLKPRTFLPLDDPSTLRGSDTPMPPVVTTTHPEVVSQDAVATLNASYMSDFVEPQRRCSVYGDVTQLEINWVNWLYNYCKPPIRGQKAIILRVWGKKSGDGGGYQRAREKFRVIARQLDIEIRGQNDE